MDLPMGIYHGFTTVYQAAGGAWGSDAAEVRGTDSQRAVDIAMVGGSIMGGPPNAWFILENPNPK